MNERGMLRFGLGTMLLICLLANLLCLVWISGEKVFCHNSLKYRGDGRLFVSPDWRLLVEADWQGRILLREIGTWKITGALPNHGPADCFAFSANNRFGVAGYRDGTVRVWDLLQKKQLSCFTGHTAEVIFAKVSADGQEAFSLDKNGEIRVWRSGQPEPVLACRTSGEGYRNAADVSFSSRRLAYASGKVILVRSLDEETGEQALSFPVSEPHPSVEFVCFLPDGRKILAGPYGMDQDCGLWLWDLDDLGQPRKFTGAGGVNTASFAGDKMLLGGEHSAPTPYESTDGSNAAVWLFDLNSSAPNYTYHFPYTNEDGGYSGVDAVHLSADGRTAELVVDSFYMFSLEIAPPYVLYTFSVFTAVLLAGAVVWSWRQDRRYLQSAARAVGADRAPDGDD